MPKRTPPPPEDSCPAEHVEQLAEAADKLGESVELASSEMQGQIDLLTKQIAELNETVKLLFWAVSEAAGLWLPLNLTSQVSLEQAGKTLARRREELRYERRTKVVGLFNEGQQ